MKEIKKKSTLIRFFINSYIGWLTRILFLMPTLFLFIYRKGNNNCLYQFFLPIAYFLLIVYIGNGKTKMVNKEKMNVRYKYRYFILMGLSFVFNTLYCLLDFYYFGQDYLSDIITVTSLYMALCLPSAIIRTYYSRGLDLLDNFYSKYEDHGIHIIIGLVVGFYVIMFGFVWIVSELRLKKIVFSPTIADYWPFFFITVIEIAIYLLFYWIYISYKKKFDEGINYL